MDQVYLGEPSSASLPTLRISRPCENKGCAETYYSPESFRAYHRSVATGTLGVSTTTDVRSWSLGPWSRIRDLGTPASRAREVVSRPGGLGGGPQTSVWVLGPAAWTLGGDQRGLDGSRAKLHGGESPFGDSHRYPISDTDFGYLAYMLSRSGNLLLHVDPAPGYCVGGFRSWSC